jgi:mRNA interferase RelE/StbE
MAYEIQINREAAKYLKKLDQATRNRIKLALEGLKQNPPLGDIVPFKEMPGYYRLRVGSYRALFTVNHSDRIIFIRTIGSRGNVY